MCGTCVRTASEKDILSASLSKTVSPTIIIVVQKIFGILLGALAIEFVVAGVIESFKL